MATKSALLDFMVVMTSSSLLLRDTTLAMLGSGVPPGAGDHCCVENVSLVNFSKNCSL